MFWREPDVNKAFQYNCVFIYVLINTRALATTLAFKFCIMLLLFEHNLNVSPQSVFWREPDVNMAFKNITVCSFIYQNCEL